MQVAIVVHNARKAQPPLFACRAVRFFVVFFSLADFIPNGILFFMYPEPILNGFFIGIVSLFIQKLTGCFYVLFSVTGRKHTVVSHLKKALGQHVE